KLYGTNKVMMSIVTFLAIIVPFGWLCKQLFAFGNLFSVIIGISFTFLIIIFDDINIIIILISNIFILYMSNIVFGCMFVIYDVYLCLMKFILRNYVYLLYYIDNNLCSY